MAFNVANLSEVRALGSNRYHWYYYTSDTLGAVLASGYFSSVYMHVGDVVEVAASSGAELGDLIVYSVTGTVKTRKASAEPVSVRDFGAKCDGVQVTAACTIASSAAALTVAGAAFTSADVGKYITVTGAGAAGAVLSTTIATYVSATQVTLTATAGATLTAASATVVYGTDDVAAWQAAYDYLATVGGGTLLHPGGISVWGTATDATGGLTYSVSVAGSNIRTVCQAGAKIITTYTAAPSNYRPLVIFGSSKLAAVSSWATSRTQDATVYAITGSLAKGVVSVTCTTVGDAANFAAGDIAYVRTGQCVSGTSSPDAELLKVLSADAATGIVTFEEPTCKQYAQEYWASVAATGATSTTSNAWPAPYGISNVTDRVLVDVEFYNLSMSGTNILQAVSIWGIYGCRLVDCFLKFGYNGIGSRDVAHCHIRDLRLHHTGENNTVPYFLGPSTGCSKWWVSGLDARSNTAALMHAHEGVAEYRVSNFNIRCADVTPGVLDVFSFVGRGYDLDINGGKIVCRGSGGNGGSAILVDQTFVSTNGMYCSVDNVAFDLSQMTGAIRDDGGQLYVGPGCRFTGTVGRVSFRGFQRGTSTLSGSDTGLRVTTGVVSYTNSTLTTLGKFPQQAIILAIYVNVTTAFNAGTTDTISVGWSGTSTALANALVVHSLSAGAVLKVQAGDTVQANGAGSQLGVSQSTAGRTMQATYAQTGGAATTGVAIVTVLWTIGARVD